jgi:hypothetical protein
VVRARADGLGLVPKQKPTGWEPVGAPSCRAHGAHNHLQAALAARAFLLKSNHVVLCPHGANSLVGDDGKALARIDFSEVWPSKIAVDVEIARRPLPRHV